MKARVITYTQHNIKIITGKLDIEIALRMQSELEKLSGSDEHIIYITE